MSANFDVSRIVEFFFSGIFIFGKSAADIVGIFASALAPLILRLFSSVSNSIISEFILFTIS